MYSDTDVEIQGIHIKGTVGAQICRCILLVLVYRPLGGNSHNACAKIMEYIQNVGDLDKKEIILLGDFNWNALDSEGIGSKCIDDIATEFNLEQIIKCPTRIGSNCQSAIDLIFTNVRNILRHGCLESILSDHYPIFMVKKRAKVNTAKVEVRKRRRSGYDKDMFGDKLRQLDWSLLDVLEDVDTMWEMIYMGLLYKLDVLCPYIFVKTRKFKPIWFSGSLATLARERDVLFSKYRRGGRKNQNLYIQAVRKRREFARLVKNAKKTFFNDQLTNYCSDQQKFWTSVHNLLGNKECVGIERVFKLDTDILLDPSDSVNEINDFFAHVGDRIIFEECSLPHIQLDESSSTPLNNFTLFDEASLLDLLKEISTHKSSGIKDITTDLLFDAIRSKPDIFVKLCNRSLETGVFPEHCKVARIKIIPKKGDLRVLDNLRPISILSLIGKILEKRVKDDLVKHFENNNLFYDLQFGFRTMILVLNLLYVLSIWGSPWTEP